MDAAPGGNERAPAQQSRSRDDLYTVLQQDGQRMAAGLIRLLHAMSADSDLNPTDFQCFALLRVGGPMTPGEIAQGLRLTTGSVTVVVDRLVARGLVRRERHPEDRRKVVVHPQEPGAVRTGTPAGLGAAMRSMHERYTEAELEVIASWLVRTGAVLEDVAAGIAAPSDRPSRRRRAGGDAEPP